MEIKISIWSMLFKTTVYANSESKEFVINDTPINCLPDDFISNVIELTKDWESNNISNATDGTKYVIEIIGKDCNRSIYGSDNLPKNFHKLNSLIRKYSNSDHDRQLEKEIFLLNTKFKRD